MHSFHFAGDIETFGSDDHGKENDLNSLMAPKQLHLKLGAPVMLLKNLTDRLINGSMGHVVAMDPNIITVQFSDSEQATNLTRQVFTIYDPQARRDIATRSQFPLRLCFALTVHKAQGLTIPRLFIDARNMGYPGQMGVAVGRVVNKKGLRVTNYTPGNVTKHPSCIYDFYQEPQQNPIQDLSCCRFHEVEISTTDKVQPGPVDVLPECDVENVYVSDEEMASILEDIDETQMAAIVEDTNDLELSAMEPALPIDVQAVLSDANYPEPETPEQIAVNSSVDFLKTHMTDTVAFVRNLWEQITQAFHIDAGITNKAVTEQYRRFHELLTAPAYRNMVKRLFKSESAPSATESNVAFKIATKVRAAVVAAVADPIKADAQEKARSSGKAFPSSAGGEGKIRYIGGWCIGSLCCRKKKQVNHHLFSKKHISQVTYLNHDVQLLDQLKSTEHLLLATSQHQESLHETKRRQNLRGGLTNISDEAFHFFQMLDKATVSLETTANLHLHAENFDSFLVDKLTTDRSLIETWSKLFKVDIPQVSSSERADNLLLQHTARTDILFHDVLRKYINMSSGQLRKNYLRTLNVAKAEATRKAIKVAKQPAENFDMDFIAKDKSAAKIASHRRLQAEILTNKDFLLKFTKANLIFIAAAYGLKLQNRSTKAVMVGTLNQTVSDADIIPYPTKIGGEAVAVCASASSQAQPQAQHVARPQKRKRPVSVQWPCGVCAKDCLDECICCDGCDVWFHALCLNMTISAATGDWFCTACSQQKAQ